MEHRGLTWAIGKAPLWTHTCKRHQKPKHHQVKSLKVHLGFAVNKCPSFHTPVTLHKFVLFSTRLIIHRHTYVFPSIHLSPLTHTSLFFRIPISLKHLSLLPHTCLSLNTSVFSSTYLHFLPHTSFTTHTCIFFFSPVFTSTYLFFS